jgi:hypothetical protein
VEYTGEFPKQAESHGNTKALGEYVQTNPDVLEKMDILLKTAKPKETYNKMISDDLENAPRNLQQVRNRKRRNSESGQIK